MVQAASPTFGSAERKALIEDAVITVLPSLLRASRRPALISRYSVACDTERMCSVSRGEYSSRRNPSSSRPQEANDIGFLSLPYPELPMTAGAAESAAHECSAQYSRCESSDCSHGAVPHRMADVGSRQAAFHQAWRV